MNEFFEIRKNKDKELTLYMGLPGVLAQMRPKTLKIGGKSDEIRALKIILNKWLLKISGGKLHLKINNTFDNETSLALEAFTIIYDLGRFNKNAMMDQHIMAFVDLNKNNFYNNKNYAIKTKDGHMLYKLIQKFGLGEGVRRYNIWENITYEKVKITVPAKNGAKPEVIEMRIDNPKVIKRKPVKPKIKTNESWRSLKNTKKDLYTNTLLDVYPILEPFKKQILESADAYQYDPNMLISAIMEASEICDVDPKLITSVIAAESKFNPDAKSTKAAYGFMQVTDNAAAEVKEEYNHKRTYNYRANIRENILCGVAYLKLMQKQFKNNELALAAYNAGPGNINKYNNSLPPYRETQKFVKTVLNIYKRT